jgi:hypothetical protein
MKTPQGHQVDGAHADDHVAGLDRLDETVRAGNHVLGLCRRVHHGDDDARLARGVGRARDCSRAELHEAPDLGVVDVADHQRVALLQQVLGHRPAHHAEAHEGDGLLSLACSLHLLITGIFRMSHVRGQECKRNASRCSHGLRPLSAAPCIQPRHLRL